jgi:bla regulator protein blaR1
MGASLGLAHVALGLLRLRRLRATCVPVNPEHLEPNLRASLLSACASRQVALCTSDAVRVPAAIGYFRPMVVFPSWALAEIPPTDLNAILLHELAHLRRYDDWTNLVQKVVKAIFFFHPAVWFVESRLTLEREMACDDAVLAADYSPRAYAESLVGLAERSFLRRGVQLAQAAVSHVQQLKMRLVEILRKDKDRQTNGRMWKPAVAVMSLAGIVSMYGVAHSPRIVAFASGTSQIASADFAGNSASLRTDSQMRPINASFTSHARSRTSAVEKAAPARLRLTHRPTPKSDRLIAQRTAMFERLNKQVPPPMLTLAGFPADLAVTPVLVVFHSEQFGANGPIVWQVTVLRFTPAQHRTLAGGSQKKI